MTGVAQKTKALNWPHRRLMLKIAVLVFLLLVLVIPPIFINTVVGYLPLVFFVLLLLLSWLYLFALSKSLMFEEASTASDCLRGSSMDFSIRLRNKGPLVFFCIEPHFFLSDLFGKEDSLASDRLSLSPFETYDFNFSVRFDHIGQYEIGLQSITIYDFFGLFSKSFNNSLRHSVMVTPRLYNLSRFDFDRKILSEAADSRTPMPLEGTDYMGVREYVPGDPMKTVHWKLSARAEIYYTKLFESYGTPGIGVVLDFNAPAYESESMMSIYDTIVETGLSIIAYAHNHGLESTLLFVDKDGRRLRYGSFALSVDQDDIVRRMPIVSSVDFEGSAIAQLRNESNMLHSQANLVLCTSKVTRETVDVLLDVKNHMKNPILMVAVPPRLSREDRRKMVKSFRRLNDTRVSYSLVDAAEQLATTGM